MTRTLPSITKTRAAKIQNTVTSPFVVIHGITANPTPNETKFLKPLKSYEEF
jgi:hypothetical protein